MGLASLFGRWWWFWKKIKVITGKIQDRRWSFVAGMPTHGNSSDTNPLHHARGDPYRLEERKRKKKLVNIPMIFKRVLWVSATESIL